MSDSSIKIDEKIIERLKKSIIIRENINLKTREKSDSYMGRQGASLQDTAADGMNWQCR